MKSDIYLKLPRAYTRGISITASSGAKTSPKRNTSLSIPRAYAMEEFHEGGLNIKQSSTNKLAFIDIDNTLTANPWDTNEKDLLDKKLTDQAIELLQKSGYLCILNTSRTEEMCMSSIQYGLSKQNFAYQRPKPQIGLKKDGKRFYLKPEEVYPVSILDLPIIISSSGAKISVLQQKGGYREDVNFYSPNYPKPHIWRQNTMLWLSKLASVFHYSYSSLESESSYTNQQTDVYPPDYRIQLSFSSIHDLIRFSTEMNKQKPLFYLINDSDPDKHSFILYITPKRGKFEAIEHVTTALIKSQIILQSNLEILVIGDSFPDFEAGIHGYTHCKAKQTMLLVGGSRFFPYLVSKDRHSFAGIDLSQIKKQLSPSQQTGYYTYSDTKTNHLQMVILGDLAFPKAIGPRSIIEFLS